MAETPNFALALQEIRQQNELNRIQQEQSDKRQKADDDERIRVLGEKIEKASAKETKTKLEADLKLLRAQIAARKDTPTKSDAKKELEAQQSGLARLREQIEANGGKAEANLQFQKQANRIRRQELELQKGQATNPSERKELAKEQRKAQFDAVKLAFAPLTQKISNLTGFMKGLFDQTLGRIPVVTLGRLAALVAIPLIIKFLNSDTWKNLKKSLLEVDLEQATGVVAGITKAVLSVFRAIGYVAGGFKDLYNLFTGNLVDENNEPVGVMKFLKDNAFQMISALGALAFFLAPVRVFKGLLTVGGKTVRWLVFDRIKGATNRLLGALGLLATQADDIALGIAGKGATTKFGGQKGATYKVGSKRFILTESGAFREVDKQGKLGAIAKKDTQAKLRAGVQSGKFTALNDPPGGGKVGYAKLLESKGFGRAAQIVLKGIPILGTLLTGGVAASILLGEGTRDEKIESLGGLLFSVLGASGLAALGVSVGALGGPFGAVGGFLLGGIGGAIAGEKLGRVLASFILGGDPPEIANSDRVPPGIEVGNNPLGSQFAGFAQMGQELGEQRNNAIGNNALERNFSVGGFQMGEGSGTMFLNTGSNVQTVNKQTIVTPIVDQDPVIKAVARSLAM